MTEAATPRTRVRRQPDRARYDAATIEAILDDGLVAHVGVVAEGTPFVLPMVYARRGDVLYLHGAPAARPLRVAGQMAEICVTVTLVDGLVMARSAFHHSMNYRSVVVVGRGEEIGDRDEVLVAMEALVEHVCPGRWAEVREPSEKELRQTRIMRLSLGEASAKVRTGPPLDDEEDMDRPVWAGEIPLALIAGAAVADPALSPAVPLSASVQRYGRQRAEFSTG